MANSNQRLRYQLDAMFPSSYLNLRHPIHGCTLLKLKCNHESGRAPTSMTTPTTTTTTTTTTSNSTNEHLCQVSSKPADRAQIKNLASELDSSLSQHRAKATGLCRVRRAIYDQCFDELIRLSTVNCLELGSLLMRVRDELRATLDSFACAYESGVCFGINKALRGQLKLDLQAEKINELECKRDQLELDLGKQVAAKQQDMTNKLDAALKMKAHYGKELAKREQIIEQQRAIIKALSSNMIAQTKGVINQNLVQTNKTNVND